MKISNIVHLNLHLLIQYYLVLLFSIIHVVNVLISSYEAGQVWFDYSVCTTNYVCNVLCIWSTFIKKIHQLKIKNFVIIFIFTIFLKALFKRYYNSTEYNISASKCTYCKAYNESFNVTLIDFIANFFTTNLRFHQRSWGIFANITLAFKISQWQKQFLCLLDIHCILFWV